MKSLVLLPTILLVALLGCVHHPVQTTFDPAYPERNGAGDPAVAVFEGRIPCDIQGCEKRKVELVLYGRDAGRTTTTYWLGQVKDGAGDDRLVQQGTWSVQRGLRGYPNGLVYVLDSSADPSLRYLWRVNDDIVLVLDQNLQPQVGNAAWGFMLSRDCTPYGPKTFPYDKRRKKFVPSANESHCVPLVGRSQGGSRSDAEIADLLPPVSNHSQLAATRRDYMGRSILVSAQIRHWT
jgi:hypothetical protein